MAVDEYLLFAKLDEVIAALEGAGTAVGSIDARVSAIKLELEALGRPRRMR